MKPFLQWENILNRAAVVLFAIIIVSPFAAFLMEIIGTGIGVDDMLPLLIPTGRRLNLLIRTLGYAAAVGLGAAVTAIAAGSFIWSGKNSPGGKYVGGLFLASLSMILVPPYVHALAWSTFFHRLNVIFAQVGFPGFRVEGVGISWWVMLMALVPMGLGFALVGFRCVDSGLVESARLYVRDDAVFGKVVIPLAFPAAAAAGVFVFLMAILDYSVPSLFFINIYTLDIFAEFSATNRPWRAFSMAVPLMAVTALLIRYLVGIFPGIASGLTRAQSRESLPLVFPRWFQGLQAIFLLVILSQMAVPLFSLLLKVGSPERFLTSLQLAGQELAFTFTISFITALAAVPLALGAAGRLAHAGAGSRWWALAVLPLAVPAPVVGVAMISLYSKPFLDIFYGTLMMPVMAALIRFLPLAAIILTIQLKRFDRNALDAAKIFQGSPLHGSLKVRLPMILPGLTAAFLATFVLTAGELGATLIVVPPGYSTLTMRIYNFMHYGSSDLIAGLCLAMLLMAFLFALLTGRVLARKGSLRRLV